MKVGKRVAQHALQASSVLTQSKLCYVYSRVSDRQLMSGYSIRALSSDADCKYSDNDCYNDDNHKLFYLRSNATACASGSYSIGNSVRCLACPAGHQCPTTDVSMKKL